MCSRREAVFTVSPMAGESRRAAGALKTEMGGPLLVLGGVALIGVAVSRRARARLGAADGLPALFVLVYALLHCLQGVLAD